MDVREQAQRDMRRYLEEIDYATDNPDQSHRAEGEILADYESARAIHNGEHMSAQVESQAFSNLNDHPEHENQEENESRNGSEDRGSGISLNTMMNHIQALLYDQANIIQQQTLEISRHVERLDALEEYVREKKEDQANEAAVIGEKNKIINNPVDLFDQNEGLLPLWINFLLWIRLLYYASIHTFNRYRTFFQSIFVLLVILFVFRDKWLPESWLSSPQVPTLVADDSWVETLHSRQREVSTPVKEGVNKYQGEVAHVSQITDTAPPSTPPGSFPTVMIGAVMLGIPLMVLNNFGRIIAVVRRAFGR